MKYIYIYTYLYIYMYIYTYECMWYVYVITLGFKCYGKLVDLTFTAINIQLLVFIFGTRSPC